MPHTLLTDIHDESASHTSFSNSQFPNRNVVLPLHFQAPSPSYHVVVAVAPLAAIDVSNPPATAIRSWLRPSLACSPVHHGGYARRRQGTTAALPNGSPPVLVLLSVRGWSVPKVMLIASAPFSISIMSLPALLQLVRGIKSYCRFLNRPPHHRGTRPAPNQKLPLAPRLRC